MAADETAFRAAIAAAPDDEAPRKVFADWLDEQGRHEEADYNRRWTTHVGKLEAALQKAALTIEELEHEVAQSDCGC